MRSRELGHQRYKEALPSVERTLHTQGCTGSTRGTRGALGCGATLSARVRGPAPGGSSETVPGAGSCASTPTPGLLSGARAAGRTAAKRSWACFRPVAGGSRCLGGPGNSPSRSCLRPESPAAPSPRRTWLRSSPTGPWILGDWEAPYFRPARLFSRERPSRRDVRAPRMCKGFLRGV